MRLCLLDGADDAASARSLETLCREFSSSEYAKTIHGIVAGAPPDIDLAAEKRLQDCLVALAADRAVESAHDLSDGGLAVAIAESAFGSEDFTARIALDSFAPAGVRALRRKRGPRDRHREAHFTCPRDGNCGKIQVSGRDALVKSRGAISASK